MITADKICSQKFHDSIKSNVNQSFNELIQDIREDLSAGYQTPHLSEEFLSHLRTIIEDKALSSYSPMKFYWTTLLENLIYVVQLHEEIQESEESGEFEFSEAEDELFNFWKESDMAQSFLEMLDENNNIIEASAHLMTILENQILSYFHLHIATKEYPLKDIILYSAIPEIGDHPTRLYIGEEHLNADFEEVSDIYPNIALKKVIGNRKGIEVEINTDLCEIPLKANDDIINLDLTSLYLLPSCKEGKKRAEDFKVSIAKALNIIARTSKGLFDTFSSFTHSIIPVNEEGIVSYSLQSLPGFSCINLFDRDFIDLMDDLLHENGHHYLNTFLNYTDLIHEDDEKIYYSPWRRALRPIRGIYHASFTFFWALKLFVELNEAVESGELDSLYSFSEEEKDKIKRRACEEFYMLSYCLADLEHAFESGKVTPEGNQLILSIYDLIAELKDGVMNLQKELSEDSSKSINELVDLLKEKRVHYNLNQ